MRAWKLPSSHYKCSHSSAAEHSAYIRTVLGSNPSGSTRKGLNSNIIYHKEMNDYEVNRNPEEPNPDDIINELHERIKPIEDPIEAAQDLIGYFFDIRASIEKTVNTPLSNEDKKNLEKRGLSPQDQLEYENDAAESSITSYEDSFADFWRDGVSPEIKTTAIKQLLNMKREDVVKQIGKRSNLENWIDAETLKKIREEE